jgi:nucleoside-diphosphate-sugar epimerase
MTLDSLRAAAARIRVGEVAPRLAADFILIHGAMLVALGGSLVYHIASGRGAFAEYLAVHFSRYYATNFQPLSLLFPAMFLANGLYTRHRGSTAGRKFLAVLRASTLATLVYLAANYMFFREELVPRSVVLLFCVLVISLLTLARIVIAVLLPSTARASAPPHTVLIVGGAGYIGSVLCRALLEQGRRVRVLDKLVYGDEALRELTAHPRFELIGGDCRNIQNVVNAVKGVDAIIHLAAIVGDPACEQDHETALQINFAATRMLIEVAKGNGVERFIFASSCSVYGENHRLMTENSALNPLSLYAKTKVDSENALLRAAAPGFHTTVLRLATVFGHSPRPRFDLVVNLLTARAHRDAAITIYNGSQWRPFIHVRDVAQGLIAVLNAPTQAVSGQIFNLGDSRLNHTLADVAARIQRCYPHTRIERLDNADRRDYRVSFDKIHSALGFNCGVSLDDGIAEMKRMLDRGLVGDYTDLQYHNQRFLQAAGSPRALSDLDIRIMAAFAGADVSGNA